MGGEGGEVWKGKCGMGKCGMGLDVRCGSEWEELWMGK